MTGKEILESLFVQTFLELFKLKIDPIKEPGMFIQALRELDPRYQGERDLVRFELEQDQTKWRRLTIDVIMHTAKRLRLLDSETPLEGDFDLVIALGGARQSNLDRLRYAAEAVEHNKATIGKLVIAGSSRKLNDAEKENVANYAPSAETEADLCRHAAAVVSICFNLGVFVEICEDEKAGNPEVIKTTLGRYSSEENIRVAVVTTQIYQTAASLDVARVARQFGITRTMAAGNPSAPVTIANRTTAVYLSEVLRTLRAAVLEATE